MRAGQHPGIALPNPLGRRGDGRASRRAPLLQLAVLRLLRVFLPAQPQPVDSQLARRQHFSPRHKASEMSSLIAAQRAYEMNAKVISAADQMLQTTSALFR